MTTSNNPKIIGVSGKDRSGKDTIAEMLIEAGYFGFSFGDAVREHALERHAAEPDPISVKNMTETANWLRAQYGADVILKQALKTYEDEVAKGKKFGGLVLFSVRAPIEVDFILDHGGELIWAQASDEVRLQRRLDNLRTGEAKVTMEDMLRQEALQTKPQAGIPVEVQMDLGYVEDHATKIIENNGSDLAEFEAKVRKELGLK